MIEELNRFFQELKTRYGKNDFVMELTITDEAAKMIPHIGPAVGESLDIYCVLGKVRIKNGGAARHSPLDDALSSALRQAAEPKKTDINFAPPEDVSLPQVIEEKVKAALLSERADESAPITGFRHLTVAGYPYVITEVRGAERHGEVQLPNGERIQAAWDEGGNEIGGRPKFQITP